MKRNYRIKIVLLALAILVAILAGCNRSPVDIDPADYFVAGCLIQVVDHDDAHGSARLWRDNVRVTDGTVHLDTSTLVWFDSHLIDSAYQGVFRPPTFLTGETVYFGVADGTRFRDSLLINVVDTFSITGNFDLFPFSDQNIISLNTKINCGCQEGYRRIVVPFEVH